MSDQFKEDLSIVALGAVCGAATAFIWLNLAAYLGVI